ncbi:hypothetical protein GCM10010303_29120 [Streptomyces purpurascens]|nr:hypothetical protein GCM10010303_29120 [Streptomyces purpurascens]
MLQALPPVRGKRGWPRRRQDVVLGARGFTQITFEVAERPGPLWHVRRWASAQGAVAPVQRWV